MRVSTGQYNKNALLVSYFFNKLCFNLSIGIALFRVICWALVFILRLRFPPVLPLLETLLSIYRSDGAKVNGTKALNDK